ncbi:MAG: hypothetical protein P1V81_17410 [Planctomycetota bacterium]|nr:hypothetical protein [Planctomycetota bacterium]
MKQVLLAIASTLVLALSTSTAPQSTCQGCDLNSGLETLDVSATTLATNGGWVSVTATIHKGVCFGSLLPVGFDCIGACKADVTYSVGDMPGGLDVWECHSDDGDPDRTECKMPPKKTNFDGESSTTTTRESECGAGLSELAVIVQDIKAKVTYTCNACYQ